MTGEPQRISLRELYQMLVQHIAETEPPFDVTAGLARLDEWIDAQPEEPEVDCVCAGTPAEQGVPTEWDQAELMFEHAVRCPQCRRRIQGDPQYRRDPGE